MRDLALLRVTLHAMRESGGGRAHAVQDGRNHRAWYAGPQPLNSQALHDLLADGWLSRSTDRSALHIDAWPSFATACGE